MKKFRAHLTIKSQSFIPRLISSFVEHLMALHKSQGTLERVMTSLLREEVRRLNAHLPRRRKTIKELLAEDAPSVQAVDGSPIVLRKEEITSLARDIPSSLHDKVKLPFLIVRRMDLGKGVYVFIGEPLEQKVLEWILGLTELPIGTKESSEPLYIYKPQVSELIRRFHSLLVIGFGVPKELQG
jgi:uncharacterized protein (UPF0216 family)